MSSPRRARHRASESRRNGCIVGAELVDVRRIFQREALVIIDINAPLELLHLVEGYIERIEVDGRIEFIAAGRGGLERLPEGGLFQSSNMKSSPGSAFVGVSCLFLRSSSSSMSSGIEVYRYALVDVGRILGKDLVDFISLSRMISSEKSTALRAGSPHAPSPRL